MRIAGVPLREWPAVGMAVLVLGVVEIGLRTTTLPRLARMLGVPLDVDGDVTAREPDVPLVVPRRDRIRLRGVQRASRHWPFGDTCLRRALAGGQRLRHRRPELQVGVALVDGTVTAHAWLVVDGHSLDPAGASSFLRLGPIEPSEVR